MQFKFLLFSGLFTSVFCAAQEYPKQYFRHPLNIPMELVANFGEIRTNHWHMGLDIRTQRRVNLPVFAAAEGYISRVSVEPGGFWTGHLHYPSKWLYHLVCPPQCILSCTCQLCKAATVCPRILACEPRPAL